MAPLRRELKEKLKEGMTMDRQAISSFIVNIGLVIKADDLELARDFLRLLENLLRNKPGVKVLFRDMSPDKLWIKRGDGP